MSSDRLDDDVALANLEQFVLGMLERLSVAITIALALALADRTR